ISPNELQIFEALKSDITRTNDRLSPEQHHFLSGFLPKVEILLPEIREDLSKLENELKLLGEQNGHRPWSWLLCVTTLRLQARLRRLEEEFKEHEQMVSICKSMLSVFRLLPPEIMTIVLKNVAISGGASPRTICNVSSYWRRVSLEFPTSWTFEHLQLFNTNDGLLVCQIQAGFHYMDDKIPSKLRELGDVVPLLPLVGKIDITGRDLARKLLALPPNTISDRLIHLELLDVNGKNLDKRRITAFKVANRLQTVLITGSQLSPFFRRGALQCKNLTVIWTVVYLTEYSPFSFLRQCVNLQDLTLYQHPDDYDKFVTWGGQVLVTLPR
ncbi:hypothetical protein H0H93_013977, partial [Arthromyces matolae]